MCPCVQESLISRLRREIDGLKSRLSSGERGWAQERRGLMAEISRLERRQGGQGDMEDIRMERGRLALIEQRIKEILAVLKSLNSMVRAYSIFLLFCASLYCIVCRCVFLNLDNLDVPNHICCYPHPQSQYLLSQHFLNCSSNIHITVES